MAKVNVPIPGAITQGAFKPDALREDRLPVDSLREAVPFLRRPFTPEAIRFKVQSVFKGASGCLIVAYIDARLVIERLNLVVPDMWEAKYEAVAASDKLLWCHLGVKRHRHEMYVWDPGDGPPRAWPDVQIHSDVGESPKGMSKDLVSDALKRAAVHFGVGVSVYALPQITLFAKQSTLLEKRQGPKGDSLVLTEKGHEKLRDGYRAWLARDHGFGEPLSHGDVEGQTLDPDAEVEDEFVPSPPGPLEDEAAQAFVAEIHDAYDAIRGIDPAAVPPARFHAWLTGAQHSHFELERLRDHLLARLDGLQGDAT